MKRVILTVAILGLIPGTASADNVADLMGLGMPAPLASEVDAQYSSALASSAVPNTNSDVDLGSAAKSFEDLFVEKILADNDSTSDLDGDVTTATTAKPLMSLVGTSLTQAHAALVQNVASAQGADLFALKTRAAAGSTNANTIIVSGDDILKIRAFGANGTAYDEAAQILIESGGTPGATTDMPGQIRFLVTPDGSATPTEALKIGPTGLLTGAAGITLTTGNVTSTAGSFVASTSGQTLHIQEATAGDKCMGTVTANGTTAVPVTTTCAVTGARIFATRTAAPSGTAQCWVTNIQNGTSFDLDCDGAETGTFNWFIIKEAA